MKFKREGGISVGHLKQESVFFGQPCGITVNSLVRKSCTFLCDVFFILFCEARR